MMAGEGKPSKPGWISTLRLTLSGRISLHVGDASDYATDNDRGWWYWTSREDEGRYRGPFRSRGLAERDRAAFRPRAKP